MSEQKAMFADLVANEVEILDFTVPMVCVDACNGDHSSLLREHGDDVALGQPEIKSACTM